MNANIAYLSLLQTLVNRGVEASPRRIPTIEVLGNTTVVDMSQPIITIKERELDYQFMAAEAFWILTGNRRLDHPALIKNLIKYSDDGSTMNGAYGPPFIQQISYVHQALLTDSYSRQAVLSIWKRSPRDSKDIPCTLSVQFFLRGDYIHLAVSMRSQDCWLGFPYDVFTFSMMALYLNSMFSGKYKLGMLHLMVGSQHLYDRHVNNARALAGTGGENLVIDSHGFKHPVDLLACLGVIRNMPSSHPNVMFKGLTCL
jgi:thymidylate synthase